MEKWEIVLDILRSRRTIRQFKQKPVSQDVLIKCINVARLAPSAQNIQPIEYLLITNRDIVKGVFPLLKWANYIAPKGNPEKGREPTAYLVMLINRLLVKSRAQQDVAAAVENFIIATWGFGIGSAWIASVDRFKLMEICNIPDEYIIDSVVALGYPDEEPIVEETDDDIKYWKDEEGVLHVPKRKIEDILHLNTFGSKKSALKDFNINASCFI
jgi:nitroreductase